MNSPEDTNTGPVIRDLRRIDPATGQVRDTGQASQTPPGPAGRGPGKSRPGRHAASKPGGAAAGGGRVPPAAPGADRGAPASQPPPRTPGSAGPSGAAGPGGPPGAPDAQAAGGPGSDPAAAARLAERTADLQRVQAEYANYRKRVERDRMAVREQALASVLSGLLPVLDDIGRAREHGELTGGFKSVAESLEATAVKLGLESFGDSGEPFDPRVHEALMHSYSADVTEPTCVQILQPGYKVGDRILRPARVAVAEPADDGDEQDSPGGPSSATQGGAGPRQSGPRGTPAGPE